MLVLVAGRKKTRRVYYSSSSWPRLLCMYARLYTPSKRHQNLTKKTGGVYGAVYEEMGPGERDQDLDSRRLEPP